MTRSSFRASELGAEFNEYTGSEALNSATRYQTFQRIDSGCLYEDYMSFPFLSTFSYFSCVTAGPINY